MRKWTQVAATACVCAVLYGLYAGVIDESLVDLNDFSGEPIDSAPFSGSARVSIAFYRCEQSSCHLFHQTCMTQSTPVIHDKEHARFYHLWIPDGLLFADALRSLSRCAAPVVQTSGRLDH